MKAVIIDDEEQGRNLLRQMLEKFCPHVEVVAAAEGVETGRAAFIEHRPDIVFLDVEMPPSTGFDVLRGMENADFQVVFVTAHDHYAIRAIRFSALDYLLKPVDIGDLKAAVAKAGERLKQRAGGTQLEVLFQSLRNVHGRVGLTTKDGLVFVHVSDIVRCEADSNYTRIFLRDGKRHVAAKTLRDFEELFRESNFVRVHQSHLVNLSHISQYIRGDGGSVVMTDGTTLEVSRRHKKDLLDRMAKP